MFCMFYILCDVRIFLYIFVYFILTDPKVLFRPSTSDFIRCCRKIDLSTHLYEGIYMFIRIIGLIKRSILTNSCRSRHEFAMVRRQRTLDFNCIYIYVYTYKKYVYMNIYQGNKYINI